MLVLSRKLFESIVIGEGRDAITVTVTRIGPGAVRLGIEAPKHVPIDRIEIHHRIKQQNGHRYDGRH